MYRGPAIPAGLVLKPLRWPGEILDGESLPGVFTRRSAEHFLGSNYIVLRACGLNLQHQGNALTEASSDNIRELARLLRVDRGRLGELVCEPVGEDFTGTVVRWGSRTMRLRDLETRFRRVSPLALSRSGHHRQAWLSRLLPFCPETFEELIGTCPVCDRPLRWTLAKPISQCDEPSCEAGQQPIKPTNRCLPKELRELYSFFARLMSSNSQVSESARNTLHTDLEALDNPTLVDLIFLMASLDRPRGERSPALTARSDGNIGTVKRLVEGVEKIKRWPDDLHAIAERAINHEKHLWARLKAVVNNHKNSGLGDLFRRAVPSLAESLAHATAPKSAPVMLQTEFIKRSGLQLRHTSILKKAKLLNKESPSVKGRRSIHFDREMAEEFIAARSASIWIRTIQHQFYIPGYGVAQLIGARYLDDITNEAIRALYPEGRITRNSYNTLVSDLAAGALSLTPGSNLPTISAASAVIGGGPKPWHEIINALFSPRITYFSRDTSKPVTFRNLLIRTKDIHVLREMKAQSDSALSLAERISKFEAGELLNAPHDTLDELCAAGMLSFKKEQRMLSCDSKQVLTLARERIFRAEASALSGISFQRMSLVARENGIVELEGGGWNRAQMMEFITSLH